MQLAGAVRLLGAKTAHKKAAPSSSSSALSGAEKAAAENAATISRAPKQTKMIHLFGVRKNETVVKQIEREYVEELVKKNPRNNFAVGDVVEVTYQSLGGEDRVKRFRGICIAKKGGLISNSFLLRNVLFGVATEMRFATYSPQIRTITVLQQQKVKAKRAKLYYLRDLSHRNSKV